MEATKKCDGSGAGVIPFCVVEENQKKKILFLLHQTYQGKKKGTLIDFGGGRN
jgi:hypothetical protein